MKPEEVEEEEEDRAFLDGKVYRRWDGRTYYDSPMVRVAAQPGYCPMCFARYAEERDMSGIKVTLGPFDDEEKEN